MKSFFSLVKFSHTVFALPFAFIGFFLAVRAHGYPFEWTKLALILLCMIFARNAAMAFNRYIDRDIDGVNPRTQKREIPAGIITAKNALIFVIVNSLLFILTTFFINQICLYLSPVALVVVLGYSYTKRFTALCHFILGLGLSLAPTGAYLAVTGEFNLLPILFSLVVLFWVSGFDIIYALQDEEFDKQQSLQSIPTALGGKNALRLSSVLHVVCAVFIFLISAQLNWSFLFWIGALTFMGLLVYQHSLVKFDDLSKVDLAFFTTNGIASVIFATFVIIDLL